MTPEERYKLITRNLQEVIGEEQIRAILKERDLKIYWGTAPTGKPHLAYFVPILKIADLLDAGSHVTILFANMHAFLDNMKSSWDLLDKRTEYYEFLIKEMLKAIDVRIDKLHFTKGTDFQLKENYVLDMYKLSALASTRDAKRAGAEVVKQLETPKLSGLLYPILQALDEQYLEVDAQFGGVDQRKIFMFAREFLPKIDYKKRAHLMNPMIPGLGESGKMSSSEPNSTIGVDDSDKIIRKKINKAFCADGVIENNGLLALLQYVVFPNLKRRKKAFTIARPDQYGGDITFSTFEDVQSAFKKKELSSIDLKAGLADELIRFISPLRGALKSVESLKQDAYGG